MNRDRSFSRRAGATKLLVATAWLWLSTGMSMSGCSGDSEPSCPDVENFTEFECQEGAVCPNGNSATCECRMGKWSCRYAVCPVEAGVDWNVDDTMACFPETRLPEGCSCASEIPRGQAVPYCRCANTP